MSRFSRRLAAAAFLVATAEGVRADADGRLSGSGPDGSRLPGVTLVVRQRDSGIEVRLATGELGLFRSPALAPGPWDVTAELAGVVTVVERGVEVPAGGERSLMLRLEAVAAADSVPVTGTVPRDSLDRLHALERALEARVEKILQVLADGRAARDHHSIQRGLSTGPALGAGGKSRLRSPPARRSWLAPFRVLEKDLVHGGGFG